MKTIQKTILFLLLLLLALILNPTSSNAATQVSDEETLLQALEGEETSIELTENIELTKPLQISAKTITINGNGHTISPKTDNWSPAGNNSSLITAGADAKLTLSNIQLTNSFKYGVQSYNGGYVILDGVTISNCKFGGVLVNAGTVEIKNLTLNKNGSDSNNGIEIAKGLSVNTGDNEPTLIMNGTLSSTETKNVIYIAINDKLSSFQVKNTETTLNKILASGNKIVVTDQNNNVIFESNEVEDISIEGESYSPNDPVNVTLPEKDITPKTGIKNNVGLAIFFIVSSSIGIIVLNKKILSK